MNNQKDTPDKDDQDLARLFSAQQDQVPEALDELILTAAKEAVGEPARNVHKRSGTAFKSWFAIAATLLLGISITPLLLQAPESALDGSASTDSTLKAVEDSLSITAEPPAYEVMESDSASGIAMDNESATRATDTREEAPASVASPVMPAIQTQSRSTMSKRGALMQESSIAEDKSYRQTPANWLAHIRKLLTDELPAEARTEYELFRNAFPNYATDFSLDLPQD